MGATPAEEWPIHGASTDAAALIVKSPTPPLRKKRHEHAAKSRDGNELPFASR